MRFDFDIIQELLLGTPISREEVSGEFMLAVWDTIQALNNGNSHFKMDLAVLIRQALRYIDCQKDPQKCFAVIRSPKKQYLPGKKEWELCNILILKEEEDLYHIQARSWQPKWLADASGIFQDAIVFKEQERKRYEPVAADPFLLNNTPYHQYNNTAQRDAIRAVVTMPPGSTLVVSIPTGSGKSLCAWLPTVLEEGLTVVVVPTVALALDQEQALSSYFPYSLAYHGGDDIFSQEKRKGIRERVLANEQRIIFTSPESITGSLSFVLFEAAKQGQFTHLVIDEAHMVFEWGNEFRPAFQRLSGIRRTLLHLNNKKLKTVLLSATLTNTSLMLLKSLFADPGPFRIYSSIQLRAEPSYWFKECIEEEKEHFLLEAVNNLPRPMIIYTTRIADAYKWYSLIKSIGFGRVGVLTSKSSPTDKNNLISAWKKGNVDLIIGTSAFGLGIDKSNVRSVIHACVPESVDRYYQEVGRGGRDGKASVSLVIYSNKDKEDARNLSKEKVITLDLGWVRWKKLFSTSESLGNHRFKVNLKERHHIRLENGDYNENWNLKTLLLMVQAGLIALDEEAPKAWPLVRKEQSYENEKKIQADSYNCQVIEILDSIHFDEHYWKLKTRLVRESIRHESFRALNTMFHLLKGNECTGSALKSFYSTEDIVVVKACGGCPNCRRQNLGIQTGFLPTRRFIWDQYEYKVSGDLQEEFSQTYQLFIFYHQDDYLSKYFEKNLNSFIRWLANRGIVAFIGEPELLQKVRNCLAGIKTPAMLYTFEECAFVPPVPKLIISHSKEAKIPSQYLSYTEHSPTILLLPFETKAPASSTRLLRDMVSAPGRILKFNNLINKYGII